MEWIFLLVGLLAGVPLGFLAGYLVARRSAGVADPRMAQLEAEREEARAELNRVTGSLGALQPRLAALEAELSELRQSREQALQEKTRLETEGVQVRRQLEEERKLLTDFQAKFKDQFQVLANQILEDKSNRFTALNQEKIGQILTPLKERLEEFRKTVAETHEKDTAGRISLTEQVRQLTDLNQKMAAEAHSLTEALRGDSKVQGNWGEVILERLLQLSGLRKDESYRTQETLTSDENQRLRPDVIIDLPDDRHVVIDSKVSLKAYEEAVRATSIEEREKHLHSLVGSIENHIKGLGSKNYQDLLGLNRSPDFVFLFIPIEGAFSAAWQLKPDLYESAYNKKIILTSPTTLLAAVSLVNSLWKQEYQNRNAARIADEAGKMYDKLSGFLSSMESLGKSLTQAQNHFESASKQLHTGTGNLVRRAESLRSLGANPKKKLPESFAPVDDESPDPEETPALPGAPES